jgi:hypothetical protein
MKTIKFALLAGLLFSLSVTGLYAQEKVAKQDLYKDVSGLDAQRNKELITLRTEYNKEMDAAMREARNNKKLEMFAEKRSTLEQKYNVKVGRIEQNYLENRSSMLHKNLGMKNLEQDKMSTTERELIKLDEEYYGEMKKFREENDKEYLQAREDFMKEGKEDRYRDKVNSLESRYVEKTNDRASKYFEKRDKIYTTQFGEIYKHNAAEQKNKLDNGNMNK